MKTVENTATCGSLWVGGVEGDAQLGRGARSLGDDGHDVIEHGHLRHSVLGQHGHVEYPEVTVREIFVETV